LGLSEYLNNREVKLADRERHGYKELADREKSSANEIVKDMQSRLDGKDEIIKAKETELGSVQKGKGAEIDSLQKELAEAKARLSEYDQKEKTDFGISNLPINRQLIRYWLASSSPTSNPAIIFIFWAAAT
jgi:DNA mismatch repair ATPase MutS